MKRQTTFLRKKIRLVTLISVVALGLAVFYQTRAPKTIEPGNGILALPVAEHEFGEVSVNRGVVSKELPLVNIGEEDLAVTFLDSSCGCTTARVINGAESGPVFGMSAHGKSPRDWNTVIKPGEQATLKIYYDPMTHPKFRGPGTRIITISTNSIKTPEKQLRIKVNQID